MTVVAIGRMVLVAEQAAERARARTASSARSSIRARPRRSTRTRSSRASRTRAGSSWSTRPTRAAASRPTSPRASRRGVSTPSRPRRMVTPPHTPVPFAPCSRTLYVPTAGAIAAAVREDGRRRRAGRGMSDHPEARHAQVGPLDDGGQAPRVARRGGRRARGRRRGRRGRDREDQRRRSRRPPPASCGGGWRAWETDPGRGLLGVIAEPTLRRGDRRVRRRLQALRAGRGRGGGRARAETVEVEAAPLRPAPGDGDEMSSSSTASAATSTTGCSTPRRWRRERTVYALDLPGHGGSSKQVGDGDVAPARGRARASSWTPSELERVHLVGHSLGGSAATLALERPSAWRR